MITTNFGYTIDVSATPCLRCSEAKRDHFVVRVIMDDEGEGELLRFCRGGFKAFEAAIAVGSMFVA